MEAINNKKFIKLTNKFYKTKLLTDCFALFLKKWHGFYYKKLFPEFIIRLILILIKAKKNKWIPLAELTNQH